MKPTVIRKAAWPALVTGFLLIAAACGGSGGAQADVEDQLGFTQEGTDQRHGRVENLIAACMRTQGFEYVPVDPKAQRAALLGNSSLSDEDFEKQYGDGITTLFEQRQKLAAGPNQAIRVRLSETEGRAYDRALLGDGGGTFVQAMDTGDFSQLGGCTRKATEEAFGGATVLASLQTKLNELDKQIENDPRLVAAIAAWSGCMRESGHDVAHPNDVDSSLHQRLEAIVGPDAAAGRVRGPNLPYDRAALAALQRLEVELVLADTRCEKKHISNVEEKVRPDYERPFRENNAQLLKQVPAP